MSDIRLALRALRATPIVSSVAILSLALGIGANTAIFSLFNALMLRPLPVVEPQRLVTVSSDSALALGVKTGLGWNGAMWTAMEPNLPLFDGGFAWMSRRFTLGRSGEAHTVDGMYTSGDFFKTLGVPALLGRTFTAADDVRGAAAAVGVISYGLWQSQFSGAASVLGTSLVVEGVPVTIVGVTPPAFAGIEVGTPFDLTLPLAAEPLIRGANSSLLSPRSFLLAVMLRLKPGQSLGAATATMRALQLEMLRSLPQAPKFVSEPFTLVPATVGVSSPSAGSSGLRQRFARPLATVLAVVALVLLIACVNIANLVLARAAARRQEMSVRLALGASPWHLARPLLMESLLLAIAGAIAGLALAAWGSRALVAQLATPTTRVVLDLSLDWRVAIFTAGVTMLTAVLFGTAPAIRAIGTAPREALSADGRTMSGSSLGALSHVLVVAQVALSLVLVVAAGLFVGTFERLTAVPLGFDKNNVLVMNVDTSRASIDAARRPDLYQQLVDAVRGEPGVARAAGSIWTPLSGGGAMMTVTAPGGAAAAERGVVANFVTPGWFDTYGIPIVEGRDVEPRDAAAASPVVVVNEALARKYFPVGSALGQTLAGVRPGGGVLTIVGVAGNAVFRSARVSFTSASLALRDPIPPTLYIPLTQSEILRPPGSTTVNVSIRFAAGAPATLSRTIGAALMSVTDGLTYSSRLLEEQVRASVAQERLVAWLSAFFGGLALLLAGLGLYGVTAYSVARRRTEIGIRMALGADTSSVVTLVLSRVAWLVSAGIVAGLLASAWLSRFVSSLLFGLAPRDPMAMTIAAITLAIAGALASGLPALRATRIDPADVLRHS
jgi:putative ABC transport system permease protein